MPKKKLKVKEDGGVREALIVETVAMDMIKATMQMSTANESSQDGFSAGEAFSVKIVCDDKAIKRLAK